MSLDKQSSCTTSSIESCSQSSCSTYRHRHHGNRPPDMSSGQCVPVRGNISSSNPAWDSVMKKFQKIKIKNQVREDPCEISNPVGVAIRFRSKKDFFCGTLMNTYIMDQFEHMIDLHLKMSHFDSMQSPEGVSMTVHNRSFTFCVFVIDGCMNVILFGKPMEAAPIIETAAAPRSRSVMPATYRHIFPHDLHHHHHHKSFSASMDNSSAIMSPLSSSLFASSGPRNASSSKTKYSRLNSTPNSTSVSSASLFSGRNWPLGRYRAERFPVPASKNSPFIVDDPDFPFPRQVYQDKKCKSMYERRHGRAP